jgi:hypothetical protein
MAYRWDPAREAAGDGETRMLDDDGYMCATVTLTPDFAPHWLAVLCRTGKPIGRYTSLDEAKAACERAHSTLPPRPRS